MNLQVTNRIYNGSHYSTNAFNNSVLTNDSKVIRSQGVGGINSMSKIKCPFAISSAEFLSELKEHLYCINKPRFNKYKQSDIVETLKVGGDTPLMKIRNGTKKGYDEAVPGDGINLAFPRSKTRRGRVGRGCSQTLDTSCNMGTIDNCRIRRLTPLECFRLQGFPDEMVKQAYEIKISDAQLYKMAGNAVTVNVVEEIGRKLCEVIHVGT